MRPSPRKSISAAAQNKCMSWSRYWVSLILKLNQANFSLYICIMKNWPCGPWMAVCFVLFFPFCSNVYIDLDINYFFWVITPLHHFRLRLFMRCSIALKTFVDINCTSLLCYNAMTCSIYIHGTLFSPPNYHISLYLAIEKYERTIHAFTEALTAGSV